MRSAIGRVIAVTVMGATPALASPAPATSPASESLLPPPVPDSAPPLSAPPPPPPAPVSPGMVDAAKLLNAEVGTRLGVRIQNPTQPDKLDDVGMDGEVEIFLFGQANHIIKWQADFIGSFGTVDHSGHYDTTGSAAVLDLIGRFELHEALNLWLGRMVVPVDRSGLSTEWLIAPWLFPGQFVTGAAPVGARRGPYGRSDGVTLWGQLGGGVFKYYLGAYGLSDPLQGPLYSGRLSLSLLSPEPGYGNASSYFGSKDLLSLGIGLQHQIDGSTRINPATDQPDAWDDFTELNADLLFEKNLGPSGVLDLEGAFYKIWGAYEPESVTYFVLASYLLPIEVGVGRFQPLFRLQQGHRRADDGRDTLVDAQLGYIIDGMRARLALDYQYSDVAGQTGNALLIGVQLQTR